MIFGVSVFSCSKTPRTPTYFPMQKEPAEVIHIVLLQGELVLDNNGYLNVGISLVVAL